MPPTSPPPPNEPTDRLDNFELTRSAAGAHLGWEEPAEVVRLMDRNATEFDVLVCRSPPLHEALGRHDHRAVVKTVDVTVTINNDLYGPAINFTYYAL